MDDDPLREAADAPEFLREAAAAREVEREAADAPELLREAAAPRDDALRDLLDACPLLDLLDAWPLLDRALRDAPLEA
ncbi:MAG TPA: hypothetical protein VGF68_18930, partial [Solirubrobacteraceae bacterium]